MLAPIFITTALLYIGYACYSLHTILCKVRPLGIPYFVVPFYPTLPVRIFLLPFVRLLVKRYGFTQPWLILMTSDWQVRQRYEIYRRLGSDVFFTVSPWYAVLHVADPDMAVGVLAGKAGNGELYPKPDIVKGVALFGENLVTTEGAAWRAHRKVTGPAIGKSLSVVWEESLTQVGQVIQYYNKPEAINTGYRDFRRATLGVISHAGFGKGMDWVPLPTAVTNEGVGEELTFQKCLNILFEDFVWTLIAPPWILKMLPFKASKKAGRASNNFRSFMNEWFEEKKAKIEMDNKNTLEPPSRADLMESLVRSSGLDKGSTLETPLLSKSDVIGNAYMFILAGHESTAHTIAHTTFFLAMYPEYQVKLQQEIDSVLGDSDYNQTSYNTHYDTFSSGWIAAIMLETLRLIPATPTITRIIGPTPRTFPLSGDQSPVTLPPGIEFWVDVIGLAHNPKYWTQPGKTEAESAIGEFRPERWLPKSEGGTMFKPHNGSYIPFSIGTRGCVGKKFAYVEYTAIILGLFREMSVEFDSCGGRKTFEEARAECLAAMAKYVHKLTLRPSGAMPALKWVRRRR